MWKIFLFSGGKSSGGGYQKVTVPVYPKVYSPERVFPVISVELVYDTPVIGFSLQFHPIPKTAAAVSFWRSLPLFFAGAFFTAPFLQGLFLQPLFSLFLPQSPVDQVSVPPSRVKSWVVEASTIS